MIYQLVLSVAEYDTSNSVNSKRNLTYSTCNRLNMLVTIMFCTHNKDPYRKFFYRLNHVVQSFYFENKLSLHLSTHIKDTVDHLYDSLNKK